MSILKFTFAIIIALSTLIITITTQAGLLRSNRVSGCWSGILIQNINGEVPGNLTEPLYNSSDCTTVRKLMHPTTGKGYKYVKAINKNNLVNHTDNITSEARVTFCCMRIQEITTPSPEELTSVPAVDFGDGPKRYKIIQVECRP